MSGSRTRELLRVLIPTRVPDDILEETREKENELFWEVESHEPLLIFRWKKSNVA